MLFRQWRRPPREDGFLFISTAKTAAPLLFLIYVLAQGEYFLEYRLRLNNVCGNVMCELNSSNNV
jgi:hypothetical protein